MSLKRDEDYDELPPAKKRHVSDDAVFDDIDPLALDKILAFLDVSRSFGFPSSSSVSVKLSRMSMWYEVHLLEQYVTERRSKVLVTIAPQAS
jgi:hypothetical protein